MRIVDPMGEEALMETTAIIVTSLATVQAMKDHQMLSMKDQRPWTTHPILRICNNRQMESNFINPTKTSVIHKRNLLLKIMAILPINFYLTIHSIQCQIKHQMETTTKCLSCRIRRDRCLWGRTAARIVTEAIIAITFSSKLIKLIWAIKVKWMA